MSESQSCKVGGPILDYKLSEFQEQVLAALARAQLDNPQAVMFEDADIQSSGEKLFVQSSGEKLFGDWGGDLVFLPSFVIYYPSISQALGKLRAKGLVHVRNRHHNVFGDRSSKAFWTLTSAGQAYAGL